MPENQTHRTPTTKELKKHSPSPIGEAEPGGEVTWQGGGPHGPGGAG